MSSIQSLRQISEGQYLVGRKFFKLRGMSIMYGKGHSSWKGVEKRGKNHKRVPSFDVSSINFCGFVAAYIR